MQRRQLSLFTRQMLPSRPSPRWSRKFDQVRLCARCGREIIARRRTVGGEVIGEFVSAAGERLRCDNSRGE